MRFAFGAVCLLGLSAASAAAAAAPAFDRPFWDQVFDGRAPRGAADEPPPVLAAAAARRSPDRRALGVIRAEQSNRRDPVWPGFSILSQPLLIYEAGVRSTLVGHPNPPPGYAPVPGAAYATSEKAGAIPDLDFVFQYHRPVNGIDSFAYRYDARSKEAQDIETIVHERFHIHQSRAFREAHVPENEVEPEGEVLALAALEQKALIAALSAADPAQSALRVRQFVAIRAARYRAHPELEAGEASEETAEGTAEYISRVLMSRPGVLAAPDEAVAALTRRLDFLPDAEQMSKARFYGTGAAQGFLLDRAGTPGWKDRVAAGESLYALTRAAYPVAAASEAALLGRARADFGYSALLQKAASVADKFRRERDAAIAAYDAAPGVELVVPIRWSPRVEFGYSSGGAQYRLKDGSVLMPELNVVDVRAPGFTLHAEKRAAVLMPDARFRIDAGAVLVLDGKAAPLADGVHPFSRISLRGAGFELSSDDPGTLTVGGGRAVVTWR